MLAYTFEHMAVLLVDTIICRFLLINNGRAILQPVPASITWAECDPPQRADKEWGGAVLIASTPASNHLAELGPIKSIGIDCNIGLTQALTKTNK